MDRRCYSPIATKTKNRRSLLLGINRRTTLVQGMSFKIILIIVIPIILLFPVWEIVGLKNRYNKCRKGNFPVNTFKLLSRQVHSGYYLHALINIYLLAFLFLTIFKFGEAFNLGLLFTITVYSLPIASVTMVAFYLFYLEKLKAEFDPLPNKTSLIKFRALELLKVLWPIPACLLLFLYINLEGKK